MNAMPNEFENANPVNAPCEMGGHSLHKLIRVRPIELSCQGIDKTEESSGFQLHKYEQQDSRASFARDKFAVHICTEFVVGAS